VEALDRRAFVQRAGRLAAAASVAPWWRLPELLDQADPRVRALARELRGDVIGHGAAGYEAARLLRNTRFDGVRPLAIAICESADDVARCVRWATRNGIRLAARSGGHSYGGYSSVAGGLVVDLSRLSAVTVAADGRTATIGAGAQLGHVYERLWTARRVTIPAGSCSTVGLAGLTLGGGHGFTSRAFGLTCDSVRALRIVTADARVLDVAANEHADLLWSSRGGGGGNFGIVTSFRFAVHPVGRVSTFAVEWPWPDAATALAAWQQWAPNAPDGVFSVFSLSAAAGGSPSVRAVGQYLGPSTTLDGLLRPLVDAGSPTRVATVDRDYLASTRYWGGGTARGTFAAASDYAFRPLSTTGIRALLDGVAARTSGPAGGVGVLLDSYGGAIRRTPPGGSAFPHRRALFSFQEITSWAPGGPAAANLGWLRRFHAHLRPYVSGAAYLNYIDPEQPNPQQAYYGASLRRLQAVKRRYDPRSVFRFAEGIRPR
jgi:FAD binding domain/Berberine and berberine like